MSSFLNQPHVTSGYFSSRFYGRNVELLSANSLVDLELADLCEATNKSWPDYGGDKIFVWHKGEQIARLPVMYRRRNASCPDGQTKKFDSSTYASMMVELLESLPEGAVVEMRRSGLCCKAEAWQWTEGFFVHMGSWDEDVAKQEDEEEVA